MAAKLHVFKEPETLFQQCAKNILQLMEEVLSKQELFYFALAGGDTPRALYRELSRYKEQDFPHWDRVRFYFGDERNVSPDDPLSNFRMANENLFQPLGISESAIQRIHGELDPEDAVAHYRKAVKTLPKENSFPQFDLVLLGMGADGHIASLFPDTPLLMEDKAHMGACYVDRLDCWRFSLTLPVINNAKKILLLVSGIKKADVVRHVIHGCLNAQTLPVEMLEHEKVEWYLDADAASFVQTQYEGEAINE